MRLTRKFKFISNSLLLLSAIIFMGLGILVCCFTKPLNDFSQAYLTDYEKNYKVDADQAIVALENGDKKKTVALLQDDLADIKKGDRLYPLKRRLLNLLVSQLYTKNTDPAWIEWAKYWFQLDDRDITALAYYNMALMQSDTDYAQGFEGLTNARQSFPDHLLLQQLYNSIINPGSVKQ